MADESNKAKAIDFFMELADKTGVAVAKVTDGHVLIFTRAHIQGLLDACDKSGENKVVVFVQDYRTRN